MSCVVYGDETKPLDYIGNNFSCQNYARAYGQKTDDAGSILGRSLRMSDYLRVDERQDVLASLEQCAMSLQQTERSKGAWKWAILSLHSAFQGAMVCHLSGSELRGALDEKDAMKWREWYERDRRGEIEYIPDGVDEFGFSRKRIKKKKDRHPKMWVASPLDLLDRLGCQEMRVEEAGEPISITLQQKESFKEYNNLLRNQFVHFSPCGWSIEFDFIKERMKDVLDIFDMIVKDPYPFRHLSDDEKCELRAQLAKIRSFIKHK